MARLSRVVTLILIQALMSAAVIIVCWRLYTHDVSARYAEVRRGAQEITSYLNHHITLCREGILRMRPEIIAADADPEIIINLMNQAVDGAFNWGLRFGWSNAQKQLTMGSVIGRIDPPYDLSGRDYVEQAFAHPGVPHFDVVSHVIFERPIMVIALGVSTPKGRYLGTLAALLDITTINETLKRIALEHRLQVTIESHKGAWIFSNVRHEEDSSEPSTTLVSDDGYMHIFAQPPPEQLRALAAHYRHLGLGLVVCLLIVTAYLYRCYIERWAVPLKRLYQILGEATGEAVVLKSQTSYDINEVVQKASHIKAIIHASQNMQHEAEQKTETLREALALIQSFQHEQATFFQSFSVEVEQVADTLEEHLASLSNLQDAHTDIARKYIIASQLPDLDTPHHMEDTHAHMRYLSQCFLVMCEDISDPEKRHAHYHAERQPCALMDLYKDAIDSTAAHHEERVVRMHGALTLALTTQKQLVGLLVFASIYLTNRFIAHDAPLTIVFDEAAQRITLTGRTEKRPVRYAAQDIFAMSLAYGDDAARLTALINADIHTYIMRYFLRNLGGSLQIHCDDVHRLKITIAFNA